MIIKQTTAVFLSLVCLFASTECLPERNLRRQKRHLGQLGSMIRHATRREALHYNNYGNHCGFQGGDYPIVDEVDRCCYNHDRCYITADAGPCSFSWFGASYVSYTWSLRGQQIHCDEENDTCRRAACQCDKISAECFSRHPWNPDHKKESIWDFFA